MNKSLIIKLIFLASLWGGGFLFLRLSSPEFGPLALIFVRSLTATIALFPVFIRSHKCIEIFQNWPVFLLIGLIGTALPFSLFSYASLYLGAGYASILNGMTPISSAVIAYFWLSEKLSPLAVFGIFLGFIGMVIISLPAIPGSNKTADNELAVIAISAILAATLCYAVSTCLVRAKFSNIPPLVSTTGSQFASTVILLPFALSYWPSQTPSTTAWFSVISLGVFSTAIAIVLFFSMIKQYGVNRSLTVTYLIPLFGVLWGWLFLNESVSLGTLLGGSIILIGVFFTTGSFERLTEKRKS